MKFFKTHKSLNPPKVSIQLKDLNCGDAFYLGDEQFVVLEQNLPKVYGCEAILGTRVISKNLLPQRMPFGEVCNDWRESQIRVFLDYTYRKKIVSIIGENNICFITRNLTSLDGSKKYNSCVDYVSLLTAEEFVKYHDIFYKEVKMHNIWWTLTPWSTHLLGLNKVVAIDDSGMFTELGCECKGGVRPVMDLNSSIFVEIDQLNLRMEI